MRKYIPILGILLPGVAWAATPRNFTELVNFFVNIFNILTALMVLGALVVFLYAISMNLGKTGESARNNLKTIMLWGIFALFIMVSVWGILRILQDTLFGAPSAAIMLHLG